MIPATLALEAVERGMVPDVMVRKGIRMLLKQRLASLAEGGSQGAAVRLEDFLRDMDSSPVALVPHLANEQHYEVPAEFFGLALGPHRKYSGCWWPEGVHTLAQAEEAALERTCSRAGIAEGQDILELGCGWGSLSLWMASRFPGSRVTAVSNSASQRAHIEAEASRRRLANLRVLTSDMNTFDIDGAFDRVVSVEMFEHMRNWRALMQRVHGWLRPGGRFFMHVFCHRSQPYAFVDQGPSDWMSRHFFSGGMMPSDALALRFQDHLRLRRRWRWDGTHYARTAEAWLQNVDQRRDAVLPVLERVYGRAEARRWLARWRIFFMSCAELFGYAAGREWWVSHYLFERPAGRWTH